jgi:hypothetical protein
MLFMSCLNNTRSFALILSVCALTIGARATLQAQGCVAVRGSSQCALNHYDPLGMAGDSGLLGPGDWQVGLSYRWLHSDRHFRGEEEQDERQENGTEVVNDSHFIDVNVLYGITPRLSLGLTVPFVYSDRSSMYEHKGNRSGERYHTQAGGIGDVRLMAYFWFWNPGKNPKGNLSLGVGPKFPTGDYEATDTFITTNGPVTGPVDQSIQPGDGGWGFGVEITGFRELFPRGSGYVQGGYLFNPQGDNGVSTGRGRPTTNPYTAKMSVPDQYFGRLGMSYNLVPKWGLSLSLGGRIEGVPVRDAIGDSEDFRRPGYSIYIEPSLTVAKSKWLFTLSGPVALFRNRERSIPDLQRSKATGDRVHGDAAFADFVILTSLSRQF